MIKKILLFIGLVLGVIIITFNRANDTSGMSSLALENIEALAQNEGSQFVCIGEGCVTCPVSSVKVLWVGQRSIP